MDGQTPQLVQFHLTVTDLEHSQRTSMRTILLSNYMEENSMMMMMMTTTTTMMMKKKFDFDL
jgi:hypothetical protein